MTAAVPDLDAYYLPIRLFGAVETMLAKRHPSLRGRLLSFDEVLDDSLHRPAFAAIDLTLLFHVHGACLDKPVYYCIFDSPSMNASVASFTNFYCIIYYSGLYQQLYPILGGLLSHEPLQHFLLAGVDPVDDRSMPRITRRDAYGALRSTGAELATKPALDLTYLLAQLMVGIVTCHELGHLVGGHLTGRATEGYMTEAPIQDGEDGRKRALEIDADIFAALAAALLATRLGATAEWAAIALDQDMAMRFLFVAAYIMFSAMDYFGPEEPLVTRKAHPAPLTRVYIIGLTVSNTLIHIVSGTERERIWDQASASVRAVEIAMLDTVGGAMMPEEATRYEAAANALWSEHIQRWPEIKSMLDRSRREVFPWAALLP